MRRNLYIIKELSLYEQARLGQPYSFISISVPVFWTFVQQMNWCLSSCQTFSADFILLLSQLHHVPPQWPVRKPVEAFRPGLRRVRNSLVLHLSYDISIPAADRMESLQKLCKYFCFANFGSVKCYYVCIKNGMSQYLSSRHISHALELDSC